MKRFALFVLIALYSFRCCAEDLASLTPQNNETRLLYNTSSTRSEGGRRQSVLGSIGTWTMLGGVVIGVAGYIEVKHATTTYGPFTNVDQSKLNTGHAAEIVGGSLFTAGLAMIIIDAIDRHGHHESRVGVIAPQYNQVGIAYKF